MIAPNTNEPGRNDPCPCGSGQKHKRCCGSPVTKALRQDLMRYKTLAHVFLSQLHKLTGSPLIAVPMDTLRLYKADPVIKIVPDKAEDCIVCAAVPLKSEPVIQAPRRIVLPNGR